VTVMPTPQTGFASTWKVLSATTNRECDVRRARKGRNIDLISTPFGQRAPFCTCSRSPVLRKRMSKWPSPNCPAVCPASVRAIYRRRSANYPCIVHRADWGVAAKRRKESQALWRYGNRRLAAQLSVDCPTRQL